MTITHHSRRIPCTCPDHEFGTPTAFPGHEYAMDYHEDADLLGGEFYTRRWLCSCGERGYWMPQSANSTYHWWLDHVEKVGW